MFLGVFLGGKKSRRAHGVSHKYRGTYGTHLAWVTGFLPGWISGCFFCEGGGKIEVLDNVEGHTAWLLHTSYIYI